LSEAEAFSPAQKNSAGRGFLGEFVFGVWTNIAVVPADLPFLFRIHRIVPGGMYPEI
jgi:hypothetical protein